MAWQNIVLTCLCYSLTLLPGTAQPVNDFCTDATVLISAIDSLQHCGGAGETWNTAQINLIDATSEINISGCALGEVPAVWFKIEADTVGSVLSLKVKGLSQSQPTMQVFAGSCSGLQPITECRQGLNGELLFSKIELAPDIDHYLVCGDGAQLADEMTLNFTRWKDRLICVFGDELKPVYRSGALSELGPYFPGDTVGFEYTISYQVTGMPQSCQWLQGVIPVFGNGWSLESFDTLGRPLNAMLNDSLYPSPNISNAGTLQGSWDWWTNVKNHSANCNRLTGDFDANGTLDMCDRRLDPDCSGMLLAGTCCGPCWNSVSQDSSGTGDLLPPGWFSSGVRGICEDDGWPAVDWGDGSTCNGIVGPWKFYFEVIIADDACSITTPGAFSITMFPFADGETGAWTGGASFCALDIATRYDAMVTCCEENSETAFLNGHLFGDLVDDCAYNGDEPGIGIRPVKIRNILTQDVSLVLTNSLGAFVSDVDTGTYWVIPQLDTIQPELCPDSIIVNVQEPCSVVTADLAIDSDLLCFEDAFIRISVGNMPQCADRYLRVEIINSGTVELTELQVHLTISDMLEFISSGGSYISLGGNQYLYTLDTIPVFGSTWFNVLLHVPCDVPIGYQHCFSASLTEDLCSTTINDLMVCRPTVASFDPNVKVDTKDMSIDITEIVDSRPIEYEIHFQNVGTAPAERVTILDTLPVLLDPATFRFNGSSHPVEISLIENHILKFFFDNIHLPDSTADEAGSHGQISYRIQPVEGLIVGDSFLNSASIYFDFNSPVITNQKQHVVVCETEFVFDSISLVLDNGTGDGAVYLFPPEGVEYTYVWSNGGSSNSIVNVIAGEYSVTITDGSGCMQILSFNILLNTGIANSEWDINVFLHPNPVSDIIYVHMETPIASVLEILTLNGSTLWIGPLPAEQESGITLGFIPPGMYLCKISSPLGVRILKFIKL